MYEFSSENSLSSKTYNSVNLSKGRFAIVCILLILAGFGFGFLGGYYANDSEGNGQDALAKLTRHADESIAAKLLEEVNAENIREYLR
jgi:hypothetical protein